MHMRLNKSKILTCGARMRRLLNLVQECMSVAKGENNNVFVHHNVPLYTSSHANSADVAQP